MGGKLLDIDGMFLKRYLMMGRLSLCCFVFFDIVFALGGVGMEGGKNRDWYIFIHGRAFKLCDCLLVSCTLGTESKHYDYLKMDEDKIQKVGVYMNDLNHCKEQRFVFSAGAQHHVEVSESKLQKMERENENQRCIQHSYTG
ncbi:hypothetical protein ACQKWADRAFT_172644 [Trichoderma austrokoningii]